MTKSSKTCSDDNHVSSMHVRGFTEIGDEIHTQKRMTFLMVLVGSSKPVTMYMKIDEIQAECLKSTNIYLNVFKDSARSLHKCG